MGRVALGTERTLAQFLEWAGVDPCGVRGKATGNGGGSSVTGNREYAEQSGTPQNTSVRPLHFDFGDSMHTALP